MLALDVLDIYLQSIETKASYRLPEMMKLFIKLKLVSDSAGKDIFRQK